MFFHLPTICRLETPKYFHVSRSVAASISNLFFEYLFYISMLRIADTIGDLGRSYLFIYFYLRVKTTIFFEDAANSIKVI